MKVLKDYEQKTNDFEDLIEDEIEVDTDAFMSVPNWTSNSGVVRKEIAL